MSNDILPAAHVAIRLAKDGRLSGKEMLDHLIAGKITIPLTEAPRIDNGTLEDWRPATASRDGTQWLIAFTLPQLAAAFMEAEPQYGYSMTIETVWVLARLPAQFGIVFNLGSEEMFEWMAEGLNKYRREVLGWQ